MLVEQDDDYPVLLEAETEEEMKEKLWKLFKEQDGFDDVVIMTKEEYERKKKEIGDDDEED